MNTLGVFCRLTCTQLLNNSRIIAPASIVMRYAANSRGEGKISNVLNKSINLTADDNESNINSKWASYNEIIYPPQDPSEERRPAYVCYKLSHVKYSAKKMWYVCEFIRGMSVDDALCQLNRIGRKGAVIAKQAINEAIELAVTEHNVEFRTNLWIAEAFATKGAIFKGLRRHAKGRIGVIQYKHCHVFLRLEEGAPPANYSTRGVDRSGPSLLEKWLEEQRTRKIYHSL